MFRNSGAIFFVTAKKLEMSKMSKPNIVIFFMNISHKYIEHFFQKKKTN